MHIKESLFPFIAAYNVNKEVLKSHKFFRAKELNEKWKNLLKHELGIYDAILEKIEKQISGTTYEDINREWINALGKEGIDNEKINDILNEINISTYDGIKNKWQTLVTRFRNNNTTIEKISNDMYTSHERGIFNVERKAASLLIAVGFSISLISVVIGFSDRNLPWYFILPSLFFFGIGIINMIIAGISAWYAERVHERSISTVKDLEKSLQEENFELNWTIKQLTHLELNNKLWTIKGNWLDVGQRHFIRGLIFTVIGFFILVTETVVKILGV